MSDPYKRVVKAALTEAKSRFLLAEALVTEIPVANSHEVRQGLLEARQAIIDAGGEEYQIETLDEWRRTGLWVSKSNTWSFDWVDGASFGAHTEARRNGWNPSRLRARKDKTVSAIRAAAGRASKERGPGSVGKYWTSEQKAAAAREFLAEPEVADQVLEDKGSRRALNSATTRRFEEQQRRAAENESEHSTNLHDSAEKTQAEADLMTAEVRLRAVAERIGKVGVSEDFAEFAAPELPKIRHFLEWIEHAVETRQQGFDEALEALLSQD